MSTTPTLRILSVSSRMPYPAGWGFARRVYHLVGGLAERHEVTMLCYSVPEDSAQARAQYAAQLHRLVTVPAPGGGTLAKRLAQGRSLASRTPYLVGEVRSAAIQSALDELLEHEEFDVALVESSQMAWLRIDGLPVVLDEHNIESALLRRMATSETSHLRRAYNKWEHVRYRWHEETVWDASAACVTTSRPDAEDLAARRPDLRVTVVPNGVDPEEFKPSGVRADPDRIVFTGLLRYRPNVEGIGWFLDHVWPVLRSVRPATQLTIVGDGPPELLDSLRRLGVTVTGWVPDVTPLLDDAAVVIVPLRIGGGTRLKVVEALAMGKAIVSTSLGSEGIDVVSGTHLELVDQPEGFAAAVAALLDDPVRRRELGAAARALAVESYSWASSVSVLEGVLRGVAGQSGQSSVGGEDGGAGSSADDPIARHAPTED